MVEGLAGCAAGHDDGRGLNEDNDQTRPFLPSVAKIHRAWLKCRFPSGSLVVDRAGRVGHEISERPS